eukprot:EG_transcript_4592
MHLAAGQKWRQLTPTPHPTQEGRPPVKKAGRHGDGKHRKYNRSRSLDGSTPQLPKRKAEPKPEPPQAEAAEPPPPTPLEVLQREEKERRRNTLEHEGNTWKHMLQFDEQRQLQIFEDELHWTRGIPGRTLRKARWAPVDAPEDDMLEEEYLNAYMGIVPASPNDGCEADGKSPQGPPPMVEPPPFVRKPIKFPKRVFEYKAMLQNQLDIRHHMGEEAIRQSNWRRVMTTHQMRRSRLPQHLLLPRNRNVTHTMAFPTTAAMGTPTSLPGESAYAIVNESPADIRLAAYWSAKARELFRTEEGRRWYSNQEEQEEVRQLLADLCDAARAALEQRAAEAWRGLMEDAAALLPRRPPPAPESVHSEAEDAAGEVVPEPIPTVPPPAEAEEVCLPIPAGVVSGDRPATPPPHVVVVPHLAIHAVDAPPEARVSPERHPSPATADSPTPMYSDRAAVSQRWSRSWEGDGRNRGRHYSAPRAGGFSFPRRQLSDDWDDGGSPMGLGGFQFGFRRQTSDDEWSGGFSSPQRELEERMRARRSSKVDREVLLMFQAEVAGRRKTNAELDQAAKLMWKAFQRSRMAARMQEVARESPFPARPPSAASPAPALPGPARPALPLPPPVFASALQPVERRPSSTPALSVHLRHPKRLGQLAISAAGDDDFGDPLSPGWLPRPAQRAAPPLLLGARPAARPHLSLAGA